MNFFDFGELIDKDTEFVIFGIPWDYLTSIKGPNSAIAPQKIREVSDNLALTSEMGFKIPKIKVVDIGDVYVEPKNVEKNLKEIENYVKSIYDEKKDIVSVMIGGDHFCTYPVVKVIGNNLKKKNNFGVLIFDSHLDLYEEWDKGVYSHATVSHRIYDIDFINNRNLLIVGTRDIDIPELDIANKEKITYLNAYKLTEIGLSEYIKIIIKFFKDSDINNLYVSIDIDALDPSIAPGTGFAIPGGFSYRELWNILRELTKNFNIRAFDVVEVAPNLDNANNMTCNLAAKLIIEFISFIAEKKGKM
ncbi:MAG: agmatinase [Candidatus Lokiarchaeota archaeon]|nr:agmatinase [Candidatus Lokiarchaeota archaeon]